MYINLDTVFDHNGNKPCRNDPTHKYRYKGFPHGCMECIRERQGTVTLDVIYCTCGQVVERFKGRTRKYCDDCAGPMDKNRRDSASRFRRTGFSPGMFAECWTIQQGRCGLCDRDLSKLPKRQVHADHEPESKPMKPRGILCEECNKHWLGNLESYERRGDCKITNAKILEWQTNPPMSKSSFAKELGWVVPN